MSGEVKAVIFDFGGVLAEEGFRAGLEAIAIKNGLDSGDFYSRAEALVYSTGYVTGMANEAAYWKALRGKTGIAGSDDQLREEILKRFVVRPDMLSCVRELKRRGIKVAILSDQTNWLMEVDGRASFSTDFDHVFNSYTLGMSKRKEGTFSKVCGMMGVKPVETLFVDDNEGNVRRAAVEGLRTIHFVSFEDFARRLAEHGLERC
jgi:putative hydrolase of the HAD superfamily